MSFDTINGTGTAAAMADGRPIIAKTGTTDTAQSAFFIGAIPQYALAVGHLHRRSQSDQTTETLNGLGGNVGGGFGGYWPARIWHTFAEDEFASLPIEQFPTPQFTGTAWNMLGRGHAARRHRPHPRQQTSRSPQTTPAPVTRPSAAGHQPVPDPDGAAHLRPAPGHTL